MKLSKQAPQAPKPAGVYAASVTPRRPNEVEVDLGAMLDALDFVAARGVNGIALFGATGEFLHFTVEERSRFIALATKRSRVPILANVSHSTLDGALALAEQAAGTGIAGVLLMPPYFFRYDGATICQFYRDFAAYAGKWTSIYLYNIPHFTNPIPIETAQELLRSGSFAGIADGGGDWEYLERLIQTGVEARISVMCGSDQLFVRATRAGAAGGVSDVAAALPELMARLCTAADEPGTAQLESRLNEFLARIASFPAPVGIREAASLRGIKTGPQAIPLSLDGRARLEQFRGWFREWIREVERECGS